MHLSRTQNDVEPINKERYLNVTSWTLCTRRINKRMYEKTRSLTRDLLLRQRFIPRNLSLIVFN